MSRTTVLILAGGKGTRLEALGLNVPKILAPLKNRTFFDWQLDLLRQQGFDQVVYSLGYQSDQVIEKIQAQKDPKLNYFLDGDKLLGTGGAVLKGIEAGLVTDPFIILYGDSYLETDYQKIVTSLDQESLGVMTVYQNQNKHDRSNIVFKDGKVVFHSKKEDHPEMYYIDWGFNLLRHEAFAPFSGEFDLSEVFHHWIKERKIQGFEVSTPFYEIGTPEGLSRLEAYLP